MSKLKRFKITYKNGTTRDVEGYEMKLDDGKLYQCCKARVGDQGVPSVINGEKIDKVECLGIV